MGIGLDGQAEGTGQTEISKLNLGASGVHEQVLWLQISVEDAMLVAVNQRV